MSSVIPVSPVNSKLDFCKASASSKVTMRFSGANNNERTIGEHIRDELKAYYLKRLRARHDKNVNAEIRGSGKDTYTTDYDPLNPNN